MGSHRTMKQLSPRSMMPCTSRCTRLRRFSFQLNGDCGPCAAGICGNPNRSLAGARARVSWVRTSRCSAACQSMAERDECRCGAAGMSSSTSGCGATGTGIRCSLACTGGGARRLARVAARIIAISLGSLPSRGTAECRGLNARYRIACSSRAVAAASARRESRPQLVIVFGAQVSRSACRPQKSSEDSDTGDDTWTRDPKTPRPWSLDGQVGRGFRRMRRVFFAPPQMANLTEPAVPMSVPEDR